jgi:multidrug efflux pump subunit AcrA (membrane-fusion protein)
MVAEARITATAPAGAPEGPLRIPSLALLDARADQGYVYVLDDKNIARRRAIATSGIDSGDVLVVSGLKSGERIVAEGAAYVRDGEAVTVADRR